VKITGVDGFVCPPQWMFVRIRTDEGITGWGEAGMQFRARAVQAAVHDLRGYLIGQDPTRIEAHWQVIRRSSFLRGGPILSSAQAAVDIALWDIVGKLHGVPIHELLGGPVRDRVRAYVWIAGDDLCDFSAEEIVEETMPWVGQGFTAFKLTPPKAYSVDLPSHGTAIVDRLTALRTAIGPDCDIALDVHGHWSKTMARRMFPALEPLDLLFVEEPVLAENLHIVRELTQSTTLPIATGERLYSRWEFADLVQSGVAVIQPDVSQAGGISELRRIAALAETYDVTVAPHCPLGPVTLAASLQIDFATPNILIQEQGITFFGDEFLRYVTNPEVFDFHDGHWLRPTGPGLGVDIDEEVVERMAEIGHDRKQPIWWHTDGSYAEF
jgi:galactonate dehydratase